VYLFYGQSGAEWTDTVFGVALSTASANWAQLIVYLLSTVQVVSCLTYVFVFIVTQSPVLSFHHEIRLERRAKTSLGASELQAIIMNKTRSKESNDSADEPRPRQRRSIAGSVAAIMHARVAAIVPRKAALGKPVFSAANVVHPSLENGSAWAVGKSQRFHASPNPELQTDPESVTLAPRPQRKHTWRRTRVYKKVQVLLTLLRSFHLYLLLVYLGSSLAGVLHHPYWFALHLLEYFRRPQSRMVLQVRRDTTRTRNKYLQLQKHALFAGDHACGAQPFQDRAHGDDLHDHRWRHQLRAVCGQNVV
jgi:hypothetical protein